MAHNHIADRNYKIVDHLRQRFKTRFNVELTRDLRLDLLSQVQKKGIDNLCKLLPDNAEVRRVKIKDNEFNVVYNVKLKQITTVLSPPNSPDFEKFCKENPQWTREEIIYSYMTPKERTLEMFKKAKEMEMDEINRSYDEFVERAETEES